MTDEIESHVEDGKECFVTVLVSLCQPRYIPNRRYDNTKI